MPAGVDGVVCKVRVAVPFDPGVRGITLGLNDAVKPVAGFGTIAESPGAAVSPELFNVIVVVAALPATTVPVVWAEVRVKSPVTETLMMTECTMLLLVAVIVTEYAPACVNDVVEIVIVEVPDPPKASD